MYRATDTSLGRQVAIKVLPDAFAQDAERLARFEREAKTLAALNHPHIAQIYGLEKSSGVQALVMELVEGEDLSQRIARGPIPMDEALPIARQIAEALEAAHEHGIIHRDLKPANIKVRPDGTVKVLDFGLAKAMEPVGAASASASMSPTITTPAMTQAGMILGTAAYMSPEQAKGREADKRSDIWAFGAVLYEMLTGTRPFDGEDVSETLAFLITKEPDWNALPVGTPPVIRTLLMRCLEKKSRARVADISTALFVLADRASLVAPVGTASVAPLPRRPLWRRVAVLTASALMLVAVTGAAVWVAMRPADPVPPRVSRLALAPSGAAALTINGNDRDLAITPDGSRLVYVGNRGTQLFVRALDALDPVVVFTGTPRGPFVSPDGQWVGFCDGTTSLKKVAITGGPAVTIAPLDGGASRGATWTQDDTIVFATNTPNVGLRRVSSGGGDATILTRPDRDRGEIYHWWPEVLPGGRAVLFTIIAAGGADAAQIAVIDLMSRVQKVVVRGGSHAHYVPTGHLVYAAGGTLRAVGFDLDRLEARGTPEPVVQGLVTSSTGYADFDVAGNGTVAYVDAPGAAPGARSLVWVDRQGREDPVGVPPRAYIYSRLSPDGTGVVMSATDQEQDLWNWDVVRHTLTRLTFDPAFDSFPEWGPDGRRVFFQSRRTGAGDVYAQAADGSGPLERLTKSTFLQAPTGLTPDGRQLLLTEVAGVTGWDVLVLALGGTRSITPLIKTRFNEGLGVVSSDGRWLAYQADDTGAFEIYVRPWPNVNEGKWQVSTDGGTRPLWARDGQELFYLGPRGAMMRVGLQSGTSWTAMSPTRLFDAPYISSASPGRSFDVSRDGRRFLMIKEGASGKDAAPPQIIVVQNWLEELKRLVPTK